jgi:multidrug resistance protein, MATE family
MSESNPPLNSRGHHLRAILKLGLPLIGSHIAQVAIGFTDALMLGWYDVTALAAQVLGGMIFFVLFIFGSGFAFAVMPMVAEADSMDDHVQARRVTRMGLWVSMLFALITTPLFIFATPMLNLMGQTPQMSDLGGAYLMIAGWGLFPALLVMVLKSFLAAAERTKPVLVITLLAVGLNAVINYVLIFGHFGAPEMGIRGAAVASLGVHALSLVLMAVYAARAFPEHTLFVRFWRPDAEAFWQVFRLGWPIGLTNLAEVGLFAAAAIMMGWLGPIDLAAHGIALQICTVSFMAHVGLSNAATVRVGRALGKGNLPDLRRGARMVLGLSALVAVATVVIFVLFPTPLIKMFIAPDEPAKAEVLAIGITLLAAAAAFQVGDAIQVLGMGLSRGIQDTRVPLLIAAVSYWIIGVPVSYVLGFVADWRGVGIWLGLAVGLAFAAAALMARFWRHPKVTGIIPRAVDDLS